MISTSSVSHRVVYSSTAVSHDCFFPGSNGYIKSMLLCNQGLLVHLCLVTNEKGKPTVGCNMFMFNDYCKFGNFRATFIFNKVSIYD